MRSPNVRRVGKDFLLQTQVLIGTGAFSKVYAGTQVSTGVAVAIKQIKKQTEKHYYENALNQIQILGLLSHKGIVEIKGVVNEMDLLYVVMQYCQGVTLDKFLKNFGRLPETQALSVLDQLLSALQHILSKNIMHRDLKPANIVYWNGNVKLLDFGFAAVFDELDDQIIDHLGTPLYMSPQILSRSTYTTKSDIWSLGVILYEMIYGHTPWNVKTTSQLLQSIMTKSVQFPAQPEISLSTKQLIKDCLKVSESSRISWDNLFNRNPSPSRKCKTKIELLSKNSVSLPAGCGYLFC